MTKSRWVGWMGVVCIVGCGQELALPDGYGQPPPSGGVGPAEGVTGLSGVGGAGNTAVSSPSGGSAVPKGGSSAGKGGAGSALPSVDGGSAPSELAAAGEGGVAFGDAGAGGDAPAITPPPPRLLLSEYVEGTGSNKALELFALQGGSLEGCELQTFANGKAEPSKLALHGAVTSGEVYVLCSSELGKAQLTPCSRSTNLSFNGDDALAIVCQGLVQDIFGEIGVDPGESWGMGATLDHTLQRRCEVTTGRTDPSTPFTIDAEWSTFGENTFSDLGRRVCD